MGRASVAVAVLLAAAVFELPHHLPKARLTPCAKLGLRDTGTCVTTDSQPSNATHLGRLLRLLAGSNGRDQEAFPCDELARAVPCAFPSRAAHAGRNCFNKRPQGLLRPASAEGGSGPGGREWGWEPAVGEYVTEGGPPALRSDEEGHRWTRASFLMSLWHKPWAKIKLVLGNSDGGEHGRLHASLLAGLRFSRRWLPQARPSSRLRARQWGREGRSTAAG